MNGFLLSYAPLLGLVLINCCVAFSQAFVLRAGIFSLAVAPLTLIGAYAAAILTLRVGLSVPIGLAAATLLGAAASSLLGLPLNRLRGVFQAIATIAFMQIVISLCLYAEALTGGAMGLNGIPKLVSNWQLVLAVAVVAYIYHQSGRSGLGRAFDVMREDEAVAAAIGIDVGKHHAIAFALSGAIAGFAGALIAYDTYSLSAQQFGFSFLVAALASVIVGGQRSTAGPIFGASLLTVLPELIRPLADQRLVLNGVILMVVMVFLPNGVVDTLVDWSRATRLTRIRRRTDAA